jgi:hypothetical protein
MSQIFRLHQVVAATVVVWAWVASVAAQDAPGAATAADQTTIWITSIVGFLSLLATQLFAIWRQHQETKAAEQRRKWDLEDRAAARAQMQKNAEQLQKSAELQRIETVQTAIELAKVSAAHREHILQEISRNTEITQTVGAKADAAFVEANNFNDRLEKLRKELASKGTQIDNIEEITGDTKDIVTELKESK